MKIKIEKTKILIVEGTHEDQFVGEALANHLHIADIQVLSIGGKTLLGSNLQALVNDPAFPNVTAVAVVRDADLTDAASGTTAANAALDAVRGALANAGLAAPPAHGVFCPGPPKTGIFIMPDGVADGALETLCVTALSTKPEYACITAFFQCMAAHGFQPKQIDKARVHAWLASRPEPDRHIGSAARAGYWDWVNTAFDGLWNFLAQM